MNVVLELFCTCRYCTYIFLHLPLLHVHFCTCHYCMYIFCTHVFACTFYLNNWCIIIFILLHKVYTIFHFHTTVLDQHQLKNKVSPSLLANSIGQNIIRLNFSSKILKRSSKISGFCRSFSQFLNLTSYLLKPTAKFYETKFKNAYKCRKITYKSKLSSKVLHKTSNVKSFCTKLQTRNHSQTPSKHNIVRISQHNRQTMLTQTSNPHQNLIKTAV